MCLLIIDTIAIEKFAWGFIEFFSSFITKFDVVVNYQPDHNQQDAANISKLREISATGCRWRFFYSATW